MNASWNALRALALCAGAAVICTTDAPAGVPILFFTDHGDFSMHMGASAKFLKHTEDFEYGNIGMQGKIPFPDYLTNGVARPPVFPEGLMSSNLILQTNRNPGPYAPVDVPSSSPQALFALGPGAFGSNSIKVGEDLGILEGVHCSMDLIFTSGDKTGVGFDLSRFSGFGSDGWTIGVFDTSGGFLGGLTINGPVPNNPMKIFFGVASTVPIGRINIFDPNPISPDAVDNIEMWAIPAPGGVGVLGLGMLAAARRRREDR